MKLSSQYIRYLFFPILLIIGIWAVVFYFNMLNEIKESIDEGLEHYKRQLIYKAQADTSLLRQHDFDEGFFAVRPLDREQAILARDRYIDTMLYLQDADDDTLEAEPVRMLTTVFENKARYYELSVFNSMAEEGDLVTELFWEAVALYIVLVAAIILISNIVLRRLWKPFYDFLIQLKDYRLGHTARLPAVVTDTREFRDLQDAVNFLLQHSIRTYEQQKQFVGNASHELQTPLAIATGKLELLLEKEDMNIVHAEEVADVLNIVERMIRLNRSLLLLTRIESGQFPGGQDMDITEVAGQSIRDLAAMADFKNVRVSLTVDAALHVHMDSALAHIIISNLLRNAIFHNIKNGRVSVTITADSCVISNTGAGGPLEAEKIFHRFYKSAGDAGTGLGLAIVKAICDLYGFTAAYRFDDNLHTFTITFR